MARNTSEAKAKKEQAEKKPVFQCPHCENQDLDTIIWWKVRREQYEIEVSDDGKTITPSSYPSDEDVEDYGFECGECSHEFGTPEGMEVDW